MAAYQAMFGGRSYVSDLNNPDLKALIGKVVAKSPALAKTALAKDAADGKLTVDDVKSLQRFLQDHHFSVGGPGADGKFGPLTHAALAQYLAAAPTVAAGGDPGATGAPRPMHLVANNAAGQAAADAGNRVLNMQDQHLQAAVSLQGQIEAAGKRGDFGSVRNLLAQYRTEVRAVAKSFNGIAQSTPDSDAAKQGQDVIRQLNDYGNAVARDLSR